LVTYALTGATWLNPVAGFVIAVFALKEGLEAWHGELVEGDDAESDPAGKLDEKGT
jgi:divalent metal cation (Fe/Co/Zn/Cd) transporter